MARRPVLGLRLQILLALAAAFAVVFALLTVASVRISQRGRHADRVADAAAAARALAAALAETPPQSFATPNHRARFARLADHVIGSGGVRGVELVGVRLSGRSVFARGVTGLGTSVDAEVREGILVRLWVRAPAPGSSPFGSILRAYMALSGGFILLLATGSLTFLIVRPVDAVTRAAGRLADGKLDQDVPLRGAAEVVELASTFNRMARQLRADRSALERRLQELEQKTTALAEARDQVVRGERLASVGRLAAGVAHEIGNPLAAILALIELLRGGDLDDDVQEEFLARIQRETERINHIIRDLLDFSRQQAHDDESDVAAAVDLPEAVEETVRLVTPQRDLGRVSIIRQVEEDLPLVQGQPDWCAQILLNLVLNAADAIEGEGDIAIRLRRERADDRDWVLLEVADSGAGIAPEVMPTLFEPFVTTKAAGKGTGLGLAVVHSLIERMKGRIDAGNDAGGGAVFRVWFRVFEGDSDR